MEYLDKEGIKRDTWSPKNQDIRKALVNRGVLCNMTMEVEFMLKCLIDGANLCDNPFDEDDYYATYKKECSECICSEEFEEETDENGETIYICSECSKKYSEDDYNRLDEVPIEICEWWAVTPLFGENLKRNGEVVIESFSKSYWGRQGCGQAIYLDGIIEKVARDMEILEGQEYSWEESV